MLVSTLLLSLTLFSQTGTNNRQNPVVCISQSTAQNIAADLLRLDSVSVELKETKTLLQKTEQKTLQQDSLIYYHQQKVLIYKQEIEIQNERFNICSNRVTKLESDVANLAKKNKNLKKWLTGIGGGFIASVGILVAVFAIK